MLFVVCCCFFLSNSLDPDKARHYVGSELGQNCLEKKKINPLKNSYTYLTLQIQGVLVHEYTYIFFGNVDKKTTIMSHNQIK